MPLKIYPRPSGFYHIRGTVQGRRVDQSARTRVRSEAEALRAQLEADLFKRSVYGDKAVATFDEAAEQFMLAGGSPDHLTALLGELGATRLADINQNLVDRLAQRMKPTQKPSTVVRQIYAPISAVMTHAARQGLCDPLTLRKPKVKTARIDYLTPAEIDSLLIILPPHLQGLVTFLVGTGCRITEALDLKWADVSPQGQRVVFWETKGDYSRGVDLQQQVRHRLPSRPAQGDAQAAVWRNAGGDPWHAYDAVNLMLNRYTERYGFRHVSCHLFRHTWATWAFAVTNDFHFLMANGGWKSVNMVMRYAHAASPDLAATVKAHGWEIRGKPARVKPQRLALVA